MKTVYQEHGYYIVNENNQFHSYNDEPAILIESYDEFEEVGEEVITRKVEGYKAWYKNGVLHRENGPAIIRNNGSEYYYLNGEIQ